MLENSLLQKRLEFLQKDNLNEVLDVVFAFFKDTLDVIGVPDLGSLANNPKEMARVMLEEPEKIITGLSYTGDAQDKQRSRENLVKAVYCRTNPTQGNDLHLTVYYDGRANPFEVYLLAKDGTYQTISDEDRIKLLGR